MESSVTYEVIFHVHVKCDPGDVVCVTGDCQQLGSWDPHKVVLLNRETEGTDTTDNQGHKDIWSKKMWFNGVTEVKYRYLTARVVKSDSENDTKSIIVTKWETHIRPRIFSYTAAVAEMKTIDLIDKFGYYGNEYQVSPGWLIDQSQITLHLHDNPIKLWNRKHREKNIRVKCTPIDHRYQDEHDDEVEGNLPTCSTSLVTVSVLRKGESKPSSQGEYGTVYTKDSHMMFSIQTVYPEHTGLKLDFYPQLDMNEGNAAIKTNNDDTTMPIHLGYSIILPLNVKKSYDVRTVPISSVKHIPLGEITFEYFIVNPLIGQNLLMDVSYQHFWKSRKTLEIGHRGMGISHDPECKTLATIRENTIKSLTGATSHGADYVELDVQLSKDKAVVVFHNFRVPVEYKKKRKGEVERLRIPVKEFDLSELQNMKVVHSTEIPGESHEEELDSDDVQPFPTLEKCFQSVDIHTGFKIEIKYPQWLLEVHELENYFDHNEVVDKILTEVFKSHGGRRIIFSSFDCNTCIALQVKQNRFPVLFLTQGDTTAYAMYGDTRTRSVEIATEFCLAHSLLGVNALSELLLKDLSRIDYVKNNGLVLFTWGEENNDKEMIKKLKSLNVDAVIYDRIDHLKTSGKESIFKVEKSEKIHKSQRSRSN